MKKQVFIIDTSAILSGKPLHCNNVKFVTTPAVSNELKPGGRDYQIFELLKVTGLSIHAPSTKAIDHVKKTVQVTGDVARLSIADIEILAVAIDFNNESDQEAIILTDDYSIQNVASILGIQFQSLSQKGITKKFKWVSRCPGCKKQFTELMKICPICGTTIKSSVLYKKKI